jgi:branched-chain amino acid transport system ATP-binding protein
MLEARNLHKSFGQLVATDDISLEFGREEGEIAFIVGPNGAGKTTLINLLTGLIEPDSGSVIMDGEEITGMQPDERVHKGLVRSFQIVHVFEEMTVRENLRVPLLSGHDLTQSMFSLDNEHEAVESEIDRLVEQFELGDVVDDVAEELPHGDRKLLDVAMSFALDPNYLLLDEPTSGVSEREKQHVISTVVDASKNRGVTTVTIEHDMDIVTEYSDRVIALHQGSVHSEGDAEMLETNTELRRLLLGVEE